MPNERFMRHFYGASGYVHPDTLKHDDGVPIAQKDMLIVLDALRKHITDSELRKRVWEAMVQRNERIVSLIGGHDENFSG